MWSQLKRKRFQILRQRELDGTLTDAEQAELSQMNAEIENSVPLDAATKRLSEQRKQIEAQNRALDALVQRKQALVNRLKAVIDELEVEQKAINAEFARLIDTNQLADTGANR